MAEPAHHSVFTARDVSRAFESLARMLHSRVEAFLIGGGAMALEGLKDSTKDVDIVVEDGTALEALLGALTRCSYTSVVALTRPYEAMRASAILENAEGLRIDLFCRSVCNALLLSPAMIARSVAVFERGQLRVRRLSWGDIFLFKGITERDRDRDDMRTLAEHGLDWDVVLHECAEQSRATGIVWESALHGSLVDLRERFGVAAPIEGRLQRIRDEKILALDLIAKVRAGRGTVAELSQGLGLPHGVIRRALDALVAEGRLAADRSGRPHRYSLPSGDGPARAQA